MKEVLKIAGVVIVCIAVAFCIKYGCSTSHQDSTTEKIEVKRDTSYIHDTIIISTPGLATTIPLGAISATLPLYRPSPHDNKGLETEEPNLEVELQRSEPPDSATVEIPIEQRHYAGENYEAWVSGYRANLDSLRVFPETQIITASTMVTKKKNNRWGLSIGAGMVATPTRVEPGIFIGATYTFLAF